MNVKPLPVPPTPDLRQQDLNEERAEESFNLLEYWRTIAKRKWSILGLAIAIAILASLVVSSVRPMYRATATVLMEPQKPKIVSIEEIYSGGGANREYMQNQVEILKSRELSLKVVEKLRLATDPEFDPRQQEPPYWKRWLASAGLNLDDPSTVSQGGPATPELEAAYKSAAAGRLRGMLSVDPVRGSQLVRISIDSYDPPTAARVANAVA